MNIFLHTGDIGDIIASLPAIKAMGGGGIVISPPQGGRQGRENMAGARFDALRPLLLAQPYVKWVKWDEAPAKISHDLSCFRQNEIAGENLAHWQARHLGTNVSLESPWLSAEPIPAFAGRVVISRSARYHNESFPWYAVVAKHPDALFVGLPEEHAGFEQYVQRKVEYQPVRHLLEMEQIIAGAALFVGNQSAPWWISAGLGVASVQESFSPAPNSRIERPNAAYSQTSDELASLRALFKK